VDAAGAQPQDKGPDLVYERAHVRTRLHNTLRRDRGVALIMSVVVISLLTLIVVEFAYEVRVDAALANNALLDLQAEYAARSAVNMIKAALRDDLHPECELRRGGTCADSLDEPWAMWVAPPQGPAGRVMEPIEIGDAVVYLNVWDEDGKINLNNLINSKEPFGMGRDGGLDLEVRQQMIRLYQQLGLDPMLVYVLADWIDNDVVPRVEVGSESDYYQTLDVPYMCKDTGLDSIDEVLLIHGYDRTIRSVLQPNVTVYGAKSKINVNTASRFVLDSVFRDQNAYLVDEVLRVRETEAYTSRTLNELLARAQEQTPGTLAKRLKTTSDVFACDCLVEIHDYQKRWRCVLERRCGPSRVVFKTLMWKERA